MPEQDHRRGNRAQAGQRHGPEPLPGVAPSTAAASSRSESIACRPPSSATIMNGTPSHTLAMITDDLRPGRVAETGGGVHADALERNWSKNPYGC